MTVAMMTPSLVPMLSRYRQAVGGAGEGRLGLLSAVAGAGDYAVWASFGMIAFPAGVALTAVEMRQPIRARAVPIGVGAVVLVAGALQLTASKARHLASCREAPGRGGALPADVRRAPGPRRRPRRARQRGRRRGRGGPPDRAGGRVRVAGIPLRGATTGSRGRDPVDPS